MKGLEMKYDSDFRPIKGQSTVPPSLLTKWVETVDYTVVSVCTV